MRSEVSGVRNSCATVATKLLDNSCTRRSPTSWSRIEVSDHFALLTVDRMGSPEKMLFALVGLHPHRVFETRRNDRSLSADHVRVQAVDQRAGIGTDRAIRIFRIDSEQRLCGPIDEEELSVDRHDDR